MQKWMQAALASLLVTVAAHSAERFSRSLSPSDFSAAGLNHLTPAELAKLDALINHQNTPVNLAESPRVSASSDPPRDVKSQPVASISSADSKQSLLQHAKVLLTPGTEIEYAVMDSELAEPFRGWHKGTVLTLVNGQRWLVTEGQYATPPVEGPVKVKVVPGALGSFFMEIQGGGKPRVKFLSKAP